MVIDQSSGEALSSGLLPFPEVKTRRENEKRRYLESIVSGVVQESNLLRKEKEGQEKGLNIVPLNGKIVIRTGLSAELDIYRHITPPSGSWRESLEYYQKYLK